MRTTHILFTVGIATAGVNPTVQFDTLPECEGGPNRVEGPPPGPPNGQPACRAKPPLTVQAATIVGVTIFPAVSEIKVGDTAEFQMHFSCRPQTGYHLRSFLHFVERPIRRGQLTIQR